MFAQKVQFSGRQAQENLNTEASRDENSWRRHLFDPSSINSLLL